MDKLSPLYGENIVPVLLRHFVPPNLSTSVSPAHPDLTFAYSATPVGFVLVQHDLSLTFLSPIVRVDFFLAQP